MLGIKIGSEFLDLSPGTTAQLERQSPFFNLADLDGEYSLPLTIPYTPRNARLMMAPNHYYTKREKTKIPAALYDENNFSYTGYLIVKGASLNTNDVTKSKISAAFVTGVSSFFQLVKNKNLKELTLGGVRSFAWTNNNPDSPVNGFWQHIHYVQDQQYDYTFDPVRNSMWSGNQEDGSADWMNKPDPATGRLSYAENYNTLCPQISLKYLLTQIFEEHGWEFDASGMNDPQWSTLYLVSFFAVTWQKVIQTISPPYFTFIPLANIDINLQNHVPPDMLITEFILAIRNRYNWGFNFDSGRKKATMFPLKDLTIGRKKDWTRYMDPKLESDFSEDKRIFSFRNEIDSADALSSAPDFKKVNYGTPVEQFADLPAPAESNFNQVVYVWKDNRYYQVRYNETDQVYEWGVFADNIYNYEPDGNNEEVTTVASTMPVYRTLYRSAGGTDYYGLFPLCEQEGNWMGKAGDFVPWGLRLLFHRGLVFEANNAGDAGPVKYPYLTSICFTITQEEPDLEWSNVYKHELDLVDKGIVRKWFSDTLRFLEAGEIISGKLNLPRQELLNFTWSDIILLKNIPFVVQKFTEIIPYAGTVTVELRRVG